MEKVRIRREKIYEYICSRVASGSAPTVREICAALHISSTSTVHTDIKALCASGHIEMTDGLNRTIRLPGESASRIPIVGTVAAGTPILAMQNIEGYIMSSMPKAKSGILFALKVKGDSMINAAILDGDIVIVEQCRTAENGAIVVAMIDDEATVKRFYKEKGRFRLQPENDSLKPIITDKVDVLGRVLCVQRFY